MSIQRITDFGTFHSRNDVLSFTIKIIIYIIPAIVIGHLTDVGVKRSDKYLDNLGLIVLQTMVNILILYLFIIFLPKFMSEFQMTMAGSYFIVLYFSMQTNYIYRLKKYMDSFL